MSKTIFFDIGNVLLFFSHEKMCVQVAEILKKDTSEVIDLFLQKRQFTSLFEEGKISFDELLQPLGCPPLLTPEERHSLMIAISDIFTPNQAIFPLVEQLKKEGAKLYIISNTCAPHYEFASSTYPIFDFFEHAVLSYKENVKKPDAKIFQIALDRANATPSTSFFIDDLYENVLGAQKCGIHSHHFRSVDSLLFDMLEKGFLEEKPSVV